MPGILSSILVFLVIFLARICWYRLIDRPNKKQAVESAQTMMNRLIQKGFGKYLLRDYTFQTQITDKDAKDPVTAEKKLNLVLREIMTYLNLTPNLELKIYWDSSGTLSPDGRAGEYDHNHNRINVYHGKELSGVTLIAVMCHECAHCLMYRNGLYDSDPVKNEYFTDITATLLGFGYYMEVGFYSIGNTRSRSKKGYLKSAEINAIRKELTAYRQKCAAKTTPPPAPNQDRKQTNEEKIQLQKHLDSARTLLEQAKSVMAVKKVPSNINLTTEDYTRLYQIAQAIEFGKLTGTLDRCESALRKEQAAIRAADNEVMKINADLSFLLYAFQ